MLERILLSLSLVVGVGCQASAGAQVEAKSGNQVTTDADASLEMGGREDTAAPVGTTKFGAAPDSMAAVNPEAQTPGAMLGARAGLRLNSTAEANCQCLSVAVGGPSDSAFVWEGTVTQTNPATQLVIGLGSEGLPCPDAARDSLGASYRGYEVVGSDVVVQVETARLGRPIAHGAIIPRPPAGGQVIVRAADRKSPYGRSPDGKSPSCQVWKAL